MPDTAELLIRPRIVGDVSGEMRRIAGTADQAQAHQARLLGRGISDAERLRAAYQRVERAVSFVGREASRTIQTTVRNIFSLRTAVMGFIAGTAGRTVLDATIGSADRIQRQRALMRNMLNDAQLVARAEQRALELTQEISSLGREQAMQGMGSLMGLAGGDVDRAAELLRLAKALESTSPEQGFEGALFALREIESGDTMSLRERFRIRLPTREDAERAARRTRVTLQQYYFDELNRQLDQRYGGGVAGAGVTNLLRVDMASLTGQWANIRTIVSDALTSIGEAARGVMTTELPRLAAELRAYIASPEFQEGARSLSELLVRGARGAFDLARWLPGAVRSVADFFRDHGTLIRTLAIGVGVNQLTGGLLTRAAGGLLSGASRGIGRLLFGARGGAVGGALGGAVGGAVPVYVVNMGIGGMGGGADYLGRNALGGGGGGLGGLTGVGRGLLLGGGAIAAVAAATVIGRYITDELYEASGLGEADRLRREAANTEPVPVQGVSDESVPADERERRIALWQKYGAYETPEHRVGRLREILANDLQEIEAIANRHLLSPEERSAFESEHQTSPASLALDARTRILDLLGGEGATWTGSEEQTTLLNEINNILSAQGLRAVAPQLQHAMSELQFTGGTNDFLSEATQRQIQAWQEWRDRVVVDPSTGEPVSESFDPAAHERSISEQVMRERVVSRRLVYPALRWPNGAVRLDENMQPILSPFPQLDEAGNPVYEETRVKESTGQTVYDTMLAEMLTFAEGLNYRLTRGQTLADWMSNPGQTEAALAGHGAARGVLVTVQNITVHTATAEEGGREAAAQVQAGFERGLREAALAGAY